jgi:hypothetical protein
MNKQATPVYVQISFLNLFKSIFELQLVCAKQTRALEIKLLLEFECIALHWTHGQGRSEGGIVGGGGD